MRSKVAAILAAVALLAASCSAPTPRTASYSGSQSPATGHVDAPSPSADPSPGSPSPSPSRKPSATPTPPATSGPSHFGTIPVGGKLPTDAQCAAWVRADPIKENKGVNKAANARTGHHVSGSLFNGYSSRARSYIAPRIDGNFTGTTAEILRWTACKWGIDESIVFAQTVMESWWRQTALGDWHADAGACPPGHGLGADGKAGLCPQSYGLLQVRYPNREVGWPGVERSSAMNADLAYASWRACYEGYEIWLNSESHSQRYRSGDVWGCVGNWFTGSWHTAGGDDYVTQVKKIESEKLWTRKDFQEP